MEIDFRKLDVKKLFDFSKEEENLIFQVYDQLFEIYDIAVIDIKDSPFHEFDSGKEIPIFIPRICYFITDKNKEHSFYLLIVNKIENSVQGRRLPAQTETLQIWGMKSLEGNFGYISINKKKWADRIAGIFSSFNINFKDNSFSNFYVLGSDKYKAMAFLDAKRKEIIKSFPDEDFKLEIKNNILCFGLPKNLSVEKSIIIAEFLNQI
ncbi:hypothetical protein [Chryseobacterium sp.]|uniref:hypothetical protein n=1 Tax=Chryseobacterium sp. TaxID=1871047 RepID=UPI00289FB088|nr:hypothetical protein [Chryseobacterium sp.]